MITIRKATLDDAIHLYVWRTHPSTQAMMRESGEIRWEDHLQWLRDTLEDASKVLLMGIRDGRPIGTTRLDVIGKEAEISVTVAPECRGAGVGAELIAEATFLGADLWRLTRFVARIKLENTASQRTFAKAGYREIERTESEVVMECP